MFLTKLVEKASFTKKPAGGTSDGLKPDDLDPRLVFHYGIPSGALLLAYHTTQKILAISTRDGRIKLFGKDGGQSLLESTSIAPSKFLLFMENQPTLVNINVNNQIEVWDLESKCLSHTHEFKKEIISCTAIPYAPYLYIGDSAGNILVLKLSQVPPITEQMKYCIPFSVAHGASSPVSADTTPIYVLPQPTAESKRVLIIYADGMIALWALEESKVLFTTGGSTTQQITTHETKKVTAATWCCPFGSKVTVGYSNGDIFLWSIPSPTNQIELQVSEQENSAQNAPLFKLNLGYKLEKIPIAKLRWTYGDGRTSRLYVIGSSDSPANLIQVVLLNEHTESRTVKLGLHPSEYVLDMEITTSLNSQSKQKRDSLFLLGKSGHVYVYEDYSIERYLLQLQSKSTPSLPKEIMVKLPFVDSSITAGKFITDFPYLLYSAGNDYDTMVKDVLPLFTFETAQKDLQFRGFSKTKNLFIAGHSNGAIKFWYASCPLLRPSLSLTQQSENDVSLSGIPITTLYCTGDLEILVSGDQSGTVRIYKLKAETFAPDTGFLSLQGVSKKGGNNLIQSIKVVKVKGAVTSIDEGHNDKHVAVGSDQGYVTLIDLEGPKVLYERQFTSELSAGIVSVQFETCNIHGFEKNVLVVATRDSSVIALETETGNTLSTNPIRPKKPSRALFMRILDNKGSDASEKTETNTGSSDSSSSKHQLVVICSEKAVYVYSLLHIVQGIKKVHYKKKFHSVSCCSASLLGSSLGLVLLFSSGKVEIRSLPELTLLKETTVRGCRPFTTKQSPISNSLVCFSSSGDAIVVEGDQEAFFISVSLSNDAYRFLDFATEVYNKDLVVPQASIPVLHKEKKKGIFGSIIKDITGTKEKSEAINTQVVDTRESIEHLSTIFSVANFPSEVENEEKLTVKEEDDNLDIDDIDIDDPGEKTKGFGVMAALNKQNFSDKFQAFKGKLKHMKVKTEKTPANEPSHEEKPDSVDDIKKRYGFASPGASESSSANMAKLKLTENSKKLQGISMKTTEMQDTAQSFSSMAKQVLRFTEKEKEIDKSSS